MFLPHAVAAADREPTFDPPLVAAEGRAKLSLSFELKGSLRISSPYDTSGRNLLNDQVAEQDLSTVIGIPLTPGREYTFVELLNAVYQQRVKNALLSVTYSWLSPQSVSLWNQGLSLVAAVHQNGALLWPAIREILGSDTTLPTGLRSAVLTRGISAASSPGDMNITEVQRQAVLKDTDFWMF
jgi:hypothetical protein